jgi:biotin operon repressor
MITAESRRTRDEPLTARHQDMPKYNPFRPGSIVTPGMFAGRAAELDQLETALNQTRHGNPHHFLIHGERGIGKTSLLFYLQNVATGAVASSDGSRYNFLTLNIEFEPANRYEDIIRKVGRELRSELSAQGQWRELTQKTWEFLSRWEILGVSYRPPEDSSMELIEGLTHALAQAEGDLRKASDGILILMDEADKPDAGANLGEFVKLLTERLVKRGSRRVALGMAGQSNVIKKLRKSHESSPRIFEMLTLEPLEVGERAWVVRKGLEEIQKVGGQAVTVDEAAEDLICRLSDGYPHFLQQFAYSSVEADDDSHLSVRDVLVGASGENGALQQLGLKYFEDVYFSQISSDNYREVLQAMAISADNWVSKAEIRSRVQLSDYVLSNAIHTLRKRGIILTQKGRRGVYRLPSKSFAVWIAGYAKALQV